MASKLSFKQLAATRPPESYPGKVKDEIDLITFDSRTHMLIGSYTYAIQKFPGDIDVRELILNQTKPLLINRFKEGLQEIVKNIQAERNNYFMEVKAGFDDRFNFPLGIFASDGFVHRDTDLLDNIKELHDKKLITPKDYKLLNHLAFNSPFSYDKYEMIVETLKKYKILRWTAKEILKGKKRLPQGKVKKLEDAIVDPTALNIEVVALVNGRFIDISNFFLLGVKNNKGKLKAINFDKEIIENPNETLIDVLKKAIFTLSFSKLNYSPFKMAKRMWSLARITKDKRMMDRLLGLINSDVSFVSQIKTDVEDIKKIIANVTAYPKAAIIAELDFIKERVSKILDLPEIDAIRMYKLLDNLKKNVASSGKRNRMIDRLEEIKDYFKMYVDKHAEEYLKKAGLLPPPSEYYLEPEGEAH